MKVLAQDRLKELLQYDADTGRFVWKIKPNRRVVVGTEAGANKDGYVVIRLSGVNYFAHRLAWLYVHGKWPNEHIDHINGDRADNRLCNLRDVNRSTNMRNMRAHKDSMVPLVGVSIDSRRSKPYRASIYTDGKHKHIGYFATADEARVAYMQAKEKYHV